MRRVIYVTKYAKNLFIRKKMQNLVENRYAIRVSLGNIILAY